MPPDVGERTPLILSVHPQPALDNKPPVSPALEPRPRLRARDVPLLLFAAAGSMVEWYDFSLFAYLTPTLSPLFFPSEDPAMSVLATYGVFALGLVVRPLGGLFFGRQGDTSGRKVALMSTLLCMSLPLLIITCLPTYQTIGVAAPILFTLCRIVMGFAVGGELSASVVTLMETAADNQRGLFANLALSTAGIGTVLAAAVNFALNTWLQDDARISYGWRVAFGVGFVLSVLCMTMRRKLHESPSYERLMLAKAANQSDEKKEEPVENLPVKKCQWLRGFFSPLMALRPYWRHMFRSTMVALGYGTSYYFCVVYLPEFTASTGAMTDSEVSLTSFILSVELAILPCLFGLLTDRIGRNGVAAMSAVVAASLAPVLVLFHSPSLYESSSYPIMLSLQLLFAAASTALGAATVCISAEPFPTSCRLSAFAIGYNLASVVVGFVPLLCEAMRTLEGDWAPAVVAVIGTIVALPAALMESETAFKPLPL